MISRGGQNDGSGGKAARAVARQVPTHDIRSEQGLLGSIILLKRVPHELTGSIRAADFVDRLHQKVMSAILELDSRGKPIDELLLMEQLRLSGDWESVGHSALTDLAKAPPHAGHVTHYADEVRKHALRRRLSLLAADIQSDVDRGVEPADILRLMDNFGASHSAAGAVSFRAYTGTELAKGSFPLTYLIEDVYVEGQPLIIGGGKKTLKTTILLDLAISLTTGAPFLGKFTVNRKVRVGVMSGESGEATIQETCLRICRAKGVELNDDIIISPDLPHVEDPAHLAALRQFIREHKINVIILDPAYLCMSGDDAASLFKTGAILRRLNDVCRQEGASLVLAHHARKKSGGRGVDQHDQPELDDLSWAGFSEFARQWILISRRQKFEPSDAGHHELWCNFGGSAGHSSLWALTIDEGSRKDEDGRRWDVVIFTPDEAGETSQRQLLNGRLQQRDRKRQDKIDQAREAIISAFRSLPDNRSNWVWPAQVLGVPQLNKSAAFGHRPGDVWRNNAVRQVERNGGRTCPSSAVLFLAFAWAFAFARRDRLDTLSHLHHDQGNEVLPTFASLWRTDRNCDNHYRSRLSLGYAQGT